MYLFFLNVFGDTLESHNIPYEVMSGFIFLTDQSVISPLFKTKYTPRAVVRLVNIFNCPEYDWMVKDE